MKRIIFILMLFFCTQQAFAQQATRQELFDQAGSAYQNGKYDEAIEHYEMIIDQGFESGALYFNLGNAYFKQGEKGKALLNYERAQRLMPRDGDLSFNKNYVLRQLGLNSQVADQNVFRRLMQSHIDFYSMNEMVVILLCLLSVGFIFYLASIMIPLTNRVRFFGLGVVTFFLLVFLIGLKLKVQIQDNSLIMIAETNALFEPRLNSTTHYLLKEGMRVQVLRDDGQWLKIKRQDGKLGWILKETAGRI